MCDTYAICMYVFMQLINVISTEKINEQIVFQSHPIGCQIQNCPKIIPEIVQKIVPGNGRGTLES